ncbi:MAG TPA: hypothetical protein VLL77_00115 [Anaerolineales bacterium]|nr:hypothetical protein [Anaerolineales bacterium]
MGVGYGTQRMQRSELEAWLGRVFVPVEPGERFIGRLRGRLVELRGARPTRGWTAMIVVIGLLVGGALWFSAAIRIVLAALAIVGILVQKRQSKRKQA